MRKLLQVREFDKITYNEAYKEKQGFHYLSEADFKVFIRFVYQEEGILSFVKISYLKNVGEVLIIKNYVGCIQMKNGLQIEILPKINLSNGKDLDYAQTKKIFLQMLYSMKDFSGKAFFEANLKIDKMNLYEVFIHMYLKEVQVLLKKGIKSSYITKEENLKCCKGRLLVSKQLKENPFHKEKFYVKFDEFQLNCPENRLIKATLEKFLNITTLQERVIKKLLLQLNLVEASKNYQKDFSMVAIDRSTKDYQKIMEWSKVFLMNRSFSVFSGNTDSRAILFPMERVYESYLARQVKKIFSKEGWDVKFQKSEQYLFVKPTPRFALRPDIILQKENVTILMDTKWKNLTRKKENYGMIQSDLYQMYTYSKNYHATYVFLLYPMSEEVKDFAWFESGDGTKIYLYCIDLSQVEKSLKELKNMIE